jgi:hypothetical protein
LGEGDKACPILQYDLSPLFFFGNILLFKSKSNQPKEEIPMKKYRFLFMFVAVLVFAALACSGGSSPTSAPQSSPPTTAPQPEKTSPPSGNSNNPPPANNQPANGSPDIYTFTDANNLFSFDLPGDWTYNNSLNDEDGVYIDRFESPNGLGFIENITGFSPEPLTGGSNGKVALYFIHKYYSTTGKEGDIRISEDQIQPDGSERLTWKSKSGGYSGMSYFEVRGDDRKTFLMFTVWWDPSADQATLDTIDAAIKSYRVP